MDWLFAAAGWLFSAWEWAWAHWYYFIAFSVWISLGQISHNTARTAESVRSIQYEVERHLGRLRGDDDQM